MEKKRIAIIAALKEELSGLKGRLKVSEKRNKGKVLLGRLKEKDVLLVETGIGFKKAEDLVRDCFDEYNISHVISIGYAGGVNEKHQIADLILCAEVLWASGSTGFDGRNNMKFDTITVSNQMLNDSEEIFSSNGMEFKKGILLTVRDVVASTEEKKWIGENYQVDAVEMETFAIAREAEKRKVPFVSLRAISDTINEELVNISSLADENGEISRLKAGVYAICHPGTIPRFISLRENTRRATKTLTEAVLKIL